MYEASNSSNWKLTTGKPLQWGCFAHGMPPPTVTWFKVITIVEYFVFE